MKKIVIATHNRGKLEEYKSYLAPLGYETLSLSDLGISAKSPEIGESYFEIAENKASFYSRFTKLPIVTEDSGLEIHALANFPGIKSDRWMEGTGRQKNLAIIQKMVGISDRRALFKVVIVYKHKRRLVTFTGEMRGEIAAKPEGVMGFGYDPIFYVPQLKRTLAQATQFEKNQLSFRGQAMQKLASYLTRYKPE